MVPSILIDVAFALTKGSAVPGVPLSGSPEQSAGDVVWTMARSFSSASVTADCGWISFVVEDGAVLSP